MQQTSTGPVFRFAPSPNGELHLGHAYSALLNQRMAQESGGKLLLRIEDIDTARCTPELERQMLDDLEWLGFEWDGEPRRQSDHFANYQSVIDNLLDKGLIYPSTMSRGEIKKYIKDKDWPLDPDGSPLYPGREREFDTARRKEILNSDQPYSLRLDMQLAASQTKGNFDWTELVSGNLQIQCGNPLIWGDVVLARKDTPASYHLCCVIDDALQGITHVVRGMDLFQSTSVHRLLQELLDLKPPLYHHHALVLDDAGKKLSKSDRSTSIRSLRKQGLSRKDVVGLLPEL